MKGNSVVKRNENEPVAPGKPKSASSTTPSVSAAITKGEGEGIRDEAPAASKASNATPQKTQI